MDGPNAEETRQALDKYCIDMTERAESGKLYPVIGRYDGIRRTIQVLQRRTKNNPILIGEPGVGKTAIVEGLAQRLLGGEYEPGREIVVMWKPGNLPSGNDGLSHPFTKQEACRETGGSFCCCRSGISPSWASAIQLLITIEQRC